MEVDDVVRAVVAGDDDAWSALWVIVVEAAAPFGREPDTRRDVAVLVMARLQAGAHRRLRLYLAAKRENPQLRFAAWLHVVARRVAIDYVRSQPDYTRGEGWRELEPLSSGVGERPPNTDRGTAHELVRHAMATLPDTQQRALGEWLSGGVLDRDARAALARLRRRFRTEST